MAWLLDQIAIQSKNLVEAQTLKGSDLYITNLAICLRDKRDLSRIRGADRENSDPKNHNKDIEHYQAKIDESKHGQWGN